MPAGQSLPRRARDYAARQQAEATAAGTAAARQWSRVHPGNIDAGWSEAYPNLLQIATVGQERASARVAPFYSQMVGGGTLETPLRNPLSGTTGDGRTVQGMLSLAPIRAKQAIAANVLPREAVRQVGSWLTMAMITLIADTARQTETLHQAVRPQVQGYVRMIEPGACSRCAIQAGRWFRSNEGFQRHPQCRCYHLPADEADADDWQVDVSAYFDSLSEAEQNRIFTNSGAEAVRAGADPSKVVNARRGMRTSQVNTSGGWVPRGRAQPVSMFGQDVYVTTEGMTRHGFARRVMPDRLQHRLMPESIVRIAKDQDDLLRLLRTYAYI